MSGEPFGGDVGGTLGEPWGNLGQHFSLFPKCARTRGSYLVLRIVAITGTSFQLPAPSISVAIAFPSGHTWYVVPAARALHIRYNCLPELPPYPLQLPPRVAVAGTSLQLPAPSKSVTIAFPSGHTPYLAPAARAL